MQTEVAVRGLVEGGGGKVGMGTGTGTGALQQQQQQEGRGVGAGLGRRPVGIRMVSAEKVGRGGGGLVGIMGEDGRRRAGSLE